MASIRNLNAEAKTILSPNELFKQKAGRKINRKASGMENSIIISSEGHEFTLMAGKARLNHSPSFLGQGVHGRVKQAKDQAGKIWAIKIFLMGKYSKTNQNILTEYKVLTKIGFDPKLVIVDKKAYLFQPVIKGQPLLTGEAMWKETYDSGYLANIVHQLNQANDNTSFKISFVQLVRNIIETIDQLHLKGILHNDLHLGNILFDINTQVSSTIDFGKANLIEECKSFTEIEEKIAFDFSFCLGFMKKKFDTTKEDVRLFYTELEKIDCLFSKENVNISGTKKAVEIAKNMLDEMMIKLQAQLNHPRKLSI